MERRYSLIPITLPGQITQIRAMAEYGRGLTLIIAGDSLRYFTFSLVERLPFVYMHENHHGHAVSLPSSTVSPWEFHSVKSTSNLVVFFLRPTDIGKPGSLFCLVDLQSPRFINPQQVVTHFCLHSLVVDGRETIFLALVDRLRKVRIGVWSGDNWSEKRSYDLDDACVDFAIAGPSVVVVLTAKRTIVFQQNGTRQQFAFENTMNPFIYPVSNRHFYLHTKQASFFLNDELKFEEASSRMVSFVRPQLGHAAIASGGDRLYASVAPDAVTVFNFSQSEQIQATIPIDDGRFVTSFGGTRFLVATAKRMFAVCDVTASFHAAIAGAMNQAIERLPALSLEAVAALFDSLWEADFRLRALELLKVRMFEAALLDVFRIFPFIRFVEAVDRRVLLQFTASTDDPNLVNGLAELLLHMRTAGGADSRRLMIDTALFQIYAHLGDISRLSAFLKEGPLLSRKSMDEFFATEPSPAAGMLFAYQGRTAEAMEAFRRVSDGRVLDEAVQFLALQAKANWPFVQTNIPWLAERSPKHCCQLLANELVPLESAISFAKESLARLYPRILFLSLFRRGVASTFVAEYLKTICPLLSSLHDERFDRESVAFCECVMADAAAPKSAIEAELARDLVQVLREFGRLVQDDVHSIETCMDDNWPSNVKVELLSVTEKIDQALGHVWGDDDSPQIAQCEKFCRDAKDPAAAFSKLIKRISANRKFPPAKRTELLTRLIADNMSAINISAALAVLDPDQALGEEIAAFLEKSYRSLVSLRQDT
jgi:hypothetical protein